MEVIALTYGPFRMKLMRCKLLAITKYVPFEDFFSDASHIFPSFLYDQSSIEDNCPSDNNFCRGYRAGANQIVTKYEKQCLEDTTEECIDVGKAAAEGKKQYNIIGNLNCIYESFILSLVSQITTEIAYEYCQFSAITFGHDPALDYKQNCREVAYGVCEGSVGDQVNDNGCDISYWQLIRLQRKCEDQVDMMTNGGDDDNSGNIVTSKPSNRPTSR